jgi:hypothetical protein
MSFVPRGAYVVLLGAFFLVSSSETWAGKPSGAAGPAKGPCSGGVACTVVPLTVSFQGTDGLGNPANVQGDGYGDYVDSVDLVSAVLDAQGNFYLKTAVSFPAVRQLFLNFNDPVDPLNAYRPSAMRFVPNFNFSTESAQPLQDQAVGSSQCSVGGIGYKDDVNQYISSYHKAEENTASSPTGKFRITRVTADQWVVDTAGGCNAYDGVVGLRWGDLTAHRTVLVFKGYYRLPAQLILNRK